MLLLFHRIVLNLGVFYGILNNGYKWSQTAVSESFVNETYYQTFPGDESFKTVNGIQ